MTKPSDKKPSGSTQGRARASANKAGATATESKKPQSKSPTPAKKPAAGSKAKSAAPKSPSVASKPASRARSTASTKPPASTPAPAATETETKSRRQRISAPASAETQTQREAPAQVDLGLQSTEDASPRDRNKIEGARLIKMIKKAIVERGLQDRAIADIVGVTQIYWNSLANGNRQIKSLGKEKLQKLLSFWVCLLSRSTYSQSILLLKIF